MTVPQSILSFLTELKANNTREWYHDHKGEYADLKNQFYEISADLIARIARFDDQVVGLQPKDAVFKLHRDIRFSHDKTPYKTHFAGYYAKGGRKSIYGGYYLHIEPQGSFLGGGIYCPQPDELKVLRKTVFENIDELQEILNEPIFQSTYSGFIDENSLKRVPNQFAGREFAFPELLKLKHYTVMNKVSDDFFSNDDWADRVMHLFEAIYPLNRFLNYALDEE